MRRASFAGVIAVALLAAVLQAQPGSETERKRLEIEKQLKLPNTRTPPPPAAEPASQSQEPAEPQPTAADAAGSVPPAAAAVPLFAPEIFQLVQTNCRSCHAAGAAAGSSGLSLKGAARPDFEVVRRFANLNSPRASPLLIKSSGQAHGGGAVLPAASRGYRRLLAWIAAGALFDAAAVPSATGAAPAARRQRTASVPPAAALRPPAAPGASPLTASVPPAAALRAPAAPGSSPLTAAPAAAPEAAAGVATSPAGPDFASEVEPLLTNSCAGCHNPKGMAAASRLVVSGDAALDHAALLPFLDLAQPARSVLLTKAAGAAHGGGAPLPLDSAGQRILLAWIAAGATASTSTAAATSAAPSATGAPPGASIPPPAASSERAPALPPAAASPTGAAQPGLELPLGLRLNGRFDLNYERRGIGRNTSFADGKSGLRSYHQFLFLSRSSADDPIGFLVEVIGLQLWEANFHHRFARVPLNLVVRGGKILVPFGNEPLFHQAYGGLMGFDQKLLPPVWAQEGVSASLLYRHERFSMTGEAYAIRGYRLKQADAILNLQNDFSAIDDMKPGFGARLAGACGPFTAYYSLYFNPLGVDRRLVMQAVDLSVWRPRGIPVLDRLVLGLGMLRADVSGGGPGRDYYHFGSYFQLRVYATEFLYVQYRQGLRTFNNRRGVYLDRTRLDADDASTHTLAVVARYHGLSVGVHYFLNFEKANEVDDDFFRVTVVYEF
jgi:hypothetical protein